LPTIRQRVQAARQHLAFSLEWKGERQGILEMRRHYANYFRGLPNFKPLRMKLVQTLEVDELFETLDGVLAEFDGYFLETKAKKVEYAGVD
jgi:tRNA-dihydrouridine synthase